MWDTLSSISDHRLPSGWYNSSCPTYYYIGDPTDSLPRTVVVTHFDNTHKAPICHIVSLCHITAKSTHNILIYVNFKGCVRKQSHKSYVRMILRPYLCTVKRQQG